MADRSRLERLRHLRAHLQSRLRGQDQVLDRLCPAVHRAELRLTHPDRPKGCFLFVGPTGVGKTELAVVLSDFLFGPDHLVTFDLSEYQGPGALARFLGDNPTNPGLFHRALQNRPLGVILFDELEKAHPDLLDLFLQLTWNGRVTAATGETLSVRPFYLIFTSNLGGAEAMRMEHSSPAAVETAILRQVQQALRPELVGRFDETCVFQKLSYDLQREICTDLVQAELTRLKSLGFDLQVSREDLELLIRRGHDPRLGARPLRRAVERHLQDAVVRLLSS